MTTPQTATMIAELARYHPVIIEGMGYYDPRPPAQVAANIVASLKSHWSSCNNNAGEIESANSNATCTGSNVHAKPKLLITQGDPMAERGISAITPLVSTMLGIRRGLVVLDDHIDPDHAANAPRDDVILECKYSDMLEVLRQQQNANDVANGTRACIATRLEDTVDAYLARKNAKRQQMDKPPLKSYFKDYAMLQEVTKAACRAVCDDITVAHTAHEISDLSVTSFYEVGIEMGLLDLDRHYVPYRVVEELDFEKIDTR